MPQLTDPEFIIDEILPAQEVHLLGGPSGSGKTTLMFQIILDWMNGRDVFGHKSHPLPFVYISCDRSKASTLRTMHRLGMDKLNIPILSLVDDKIPRNFTCVVAAAKKLIPGVKVLFIDAFAALTPDGKTNDYGRVSDFLVRFATMCIDESITVVGLVHSTKVKEGENFLNPRQRLLGSVAWAGFADTIILVEPAKPEVATDATRKVTVLPRNAATEEYIYHFDNVGKLVITEDDNSNFILEQELAKIAIGQEVSTGFLIDMGNSRSIGKRTVERWITLALEGAKLERVRKGTFKRPFTT